MANIYNSAPSAYDYPLLVKQLLNRAKNSLSGPGDSVCGQEKTDL